MRTARDTRRLHPLSNTFFGFILLAITAVILTGCGSSGGSNPSNPVITGVVVDEYVRDATVTAYADRGLSRVIGTGNTDENGNFRITLDVDELPEILYLKSVGGFNLDTGLPAPTMLFVGRGSLERFAITPITDSIYWASVRTDLDNALQDMADRLGLTLEALYDDPMAQGHMDAVDKVLASGTQTGTLPDGTYTGTLLYLEERNLAGESDAHTYNDIATIVENNSHELTIQIQDGEISGELDEGDDITGRVQGSSMLLSVVAHDDDTHEVVEVAQVAGSIGLMGSVSGHYLHADLLDEGNAEVVRGFFVASFQPAQGVDFAKMEELVSTVYEGEHDMLFRDVLGADREQLSGMLEVVSADFDGTFSIDANVHDVSFANGTLIDMKTEEGEFVSLSEPTKTGLAVLEVTVDAEDKAYLLQAVGNRRGIFLAVDDTDKATAIGEFYASSSKGITPGVLPETNDSLRLAVADPAMI
ncbi:MAG: hypothetical protein ACLFQR_13420, partial [Desulfovibrionales bacterium]